MTTRKDSKGFTLIEILLVIVLLGLLATAVIPRVGSIFRASVASSVRRFSALVRFTYDQSVLTGRVHKIVLNLDEQKWKVEAAQAGALPTDPERLKKDPDLAQPAFQDIKSNVVSNNLPKGVRIVSVSSWRYGKKGDVVTKGEVAIYAFPNGMMDEASVTLAEDGKEKLQRFRATIQPLTGRVTVETENEAP